MAKKKQKTTIRNKKLTGRELILDYLNPSSEGIIFLEPAELDEAIIGYTYSAGVVRLIYSGDKLILINMNNGMSREEAEEYYDFNTVRAIPYMGINAPILLESLPSKVTITGTLH